ncbi:MAG: hypothetical protein JSV77_01355 [Dehalococcoidales bacterium]|nr:MAG: hypothetical protein JSV77_01355 [Dehalococcoidales bacterium]
MRRPAGVIFDLGDTVLHLESIDMISANKRLLEFAEGNTDLTAEDVQRFAEELSREALQVREDSWSSTVFRVSRDYCMGIWVFPLPSVHMSWRGSSGMLL